MTDQENYADFERKYYEFAGLANDSSIGSPARKIYEIKMLQYAYAANIPTDFFKFEGWTRREIAASRSGSGSAIIFGIAAQQTEQLSLRAFVEAKTYLKAILNPDVARGKESRRATKELFKNVSPDDLYRAIHMTGNESVFNQAIAAQPPYLPDAHIKQYPAWKAKNGKFIREAAAHVERREKDDDTTKLRAQFNSLIELRRSPESTPEEKAFYDLFIYQQNKWPLSIKFGLHVETHHTPEQRELIDESITRFFCKYVLVHKDNLGTTAKRYASAQISTWMVSPEEFLEHMKYNLDDIPQIIEICRLQEDKEIDWPKFNALYEQAKIITQISVSAGPRVTHIDVDHDLVVSGSNDRSMGYMAVDEKLDDTTPPAGNDEDDNEDRTKKLEDWLKSIPNSGIEDIFVRRCTRVLTEDGKKRKPYNLVDIHMADKEIIRVAVCDYRAHMTFVERGASPYVENQALKISELRKNDRVWRAIHFTDTQWFEKLRGILFTPTNELTVEDKTRTAWVSLKNELAASFAATIMATCQIPIRTQNIKFAHGPLAGYITLSKAFSAAYEGRIDGIPEKTTYNRLFDMLAKGDSPPMPHLARFLNKPPVTDAMILTACDAYKREMGQPIAPDVFELLLIDVIDTRMSESDADMRRRGPDIDLAFKAEAVHIPVEKVATWGKYPCGLQEFLELENILAVPAPAVA